MLNLFNTYLLEDKPRTNGHNGTIRVPRHELLNPKNSEKLYLAMKITDTDKWLSLGYVYSEDIQSTQKFN